MIKRLLYILLVLLFASICWAANVYIDPEWAGTNSGTFAEPHDWASFISAGISASDDYYFRCGSSETLSSTWTISTDGTDVNSIKFGAYYDSGGEPAGSAPSGSAVIEPGTFGSLCANGDAKPIIRRASQASTAAIVMGGTAAGQYLELHSLSIQQTETAIWLRSSFNELRYLYIYTTEFGIRGGTSEDHDDNTIEYNDININDSGGGSGDAIKLDWNGQDNIVQYNKVRGQDHSAIYIEAGDRNTIQYNYMPQGVVDDTNCIDLSGGNNGSNDNIIRFNFCEDSGTPLKIYGGSDNEVYGNVFTGNSDEPDAGHGCLMIQAYDTGDTNDNLLYNNVCYDFDTHDSIRGVYFVALADTTGDVSGNVFANNVFLTQSSTVFWVYDASGVIGTNYFYNNSGYDYITDADCVGEDDPDVCCDAVGVGSCGYARIENTPYDTAADFNAVAYASGNRDNDPGLEDAVSHELWPASDSSDVVGNGYNLGTSYDDLINPDSTDFTTAAPSVTIVEVLDYEVIGAYIYSGYGGSGTGQTVLKGAGGNFNLGN